MAIESVLSRYAAALTALNAREAKAVWPSVNERGLTRAFASLQEQRVDLGDCSIWVDGDSAVASCEGTTRYTPKVGNRSVRSEPRQWTFHLQQNGAVWSIGSVISR